MYLIVAVDEQNGMMFHRRRQSRDRVLCERILSLADGTRLWMNSYSFKLFEGCTEKNSIVAEDDFLSKAGKEEYCFAEDILPNEAEVEKIIVFRWNRRYPGDFFFDFDIFAWNLVETEDFAGSSHEKITMEVYER